MAHKWIKNYYNHKGHAIIECSCGRIFQGFDEETAQNNFFNHKTNYENAENKTSTNTRTKH